MTHGRSIRPARLGPALALLVSLALVAGCSSGSETEATPSATASVSGSPSASATPPPPPPPYLKVPPGVELTLPGEELALGKLATVAWKLPKPKGKTKKGKKRKRPIAVVDVRVRTTTAATLKQFAGWDLNEAARKSNPYFVTATFTNVGKSNLSGVRIPLFIVDGTNTLIQASTFEGEFKPCASTPFPEKFKPGKRVKMCSVYLSPKNGKLAAVSFRPTVKFDPIIWVGENPRPDEKKKKKKKKKSDKAEPTP